MKKELLAIFSNATMKSDLLLPIYSQQLTSLELIYFWFMLNYTAELETISIVWNQIIWLKLLILQLRG